MAENRDVVGYSLMATKLRLPSLPFRRVERPQLVERLNEGLRLGRHLTLVSAPAGFGKTTCIGEWLSGLEEWPVSWLSLDAADDDPERFFSYLVAALQKIDGRLGRDVEGVLRSGQLPPGDVIAAILANDLQAWGGRCLLVLDDFHVIQDRTILQVLEKVVANLPPALHLVLLTREDPSLPLARLRANNQLTEIRAGELRFSTQDAERFLNGVMGLELSQADVAVLEDRTEGWIAGLQLAGLSVRDRADPSGFIATLSGSHRFILSYLSEEVLARQPEEVRQFLLLTSILDRLSGGLCDAVTGRTDGRLMLERLFNANLFLIPLDDEQQWYRYHHLFADLLRDLLRALYPEQTAELHRRASRWYAQAGMAGEAVRHALAAADFETAMRLIESHAVEMLVQGYSKTVEEWLHAIPAELRLQSPRTNMAFAWMHLMRGNFPQVQPYVERLQAIFSGAPPGTQDRAQDRAQDLSLQAEWLALQSYLVAAQGRPEQGVALAQQALEIAPERDDYVRSLAYNGLASAYHTMNDYTRSIEACRQAIQYGRATGSFEPEIMGTAILVQIALQLGRLHLAYEVAAEGVARFENRGLLSPITAAVYGALGEVHYQWHQLEQAQGYFTRAIQMATLSGYSDAEIYQRVILSRLYLARLDLEAAAREIQNAIDLMRIEAPVWVHEEVVSQQVRVEVARQRPDAAEAILKQHGFADRGRFSIPDLAPGRPMAHSLGLLYNSALRVLLARAGHPLGSDPLDSDPSALPRLRVSGRGASLGARRGTRREPGLLQRGIELAGAVRDAALQGQYVPIALEALLLRAQMQTALGNRQAGLADVAAAIELAAPEGFVSLFVEEGAPIAEALTTLHQRQPASPQADYVMSILAAFPSPGRVEEAEPEPPAPAPARPGGRAGAAGGAEGRGLIEPLSQRELEVLELIGDGCSNQEIAERLVLSLHTVKKHVSNILDKLGVESRTRAVAQARTLKLIRDQQD